VDRTLGDHRNQVDLDVGAAGTHDRWARRRDLAFASDGKTLFTLQGTGIDLATGKRTSHTTVTTPPEARGYFTIRMSSDGATVAYSALSNVWDLFVLESARC
jgi:hypothetical protein